MLRSFLFIFLSLAAIPSYGATRYVLEENGHAMVLDTFNDGVVRLSGHPYKNKLYYNIHKKTFYVVMEEEGFTFSLPIHKLDQFPQASLSKMQGYPAKKFSKFDGEPWKLSVDNQNCGVVYANKLIQQSNDLTFTDVAAINIAIQYLFGSGELAACQAYTVPTALGNWVGFPVGFETAKGGKSQLKEQYSIENEEIKLFKWSEPFTVDRHVYVLEKELNEQNKMHYEHLKVKAKNDPIVLLQTLQKLLAQQQRSS